ncbi:hypothetical protein IV77_GL000986 [Olsenella uli DSM 7084]|nr:hypothetical protein HMPREF1503_0664 [Olsenella uli MSTE5]KRO13528.1 hypothetical protein IV77_GL000986 [Olsenella uli DSM 7084]
MRPSRRSHWSHSSSRSECVECLCLAQIYQRVGYSRHRKAFRPHGRSTRPRRDRTWHSTNASLRS